MSKQAIEIVAGLVDYIEQQIANPNPAALNLSAIADAAGYSRFHLHRMFTQVAGLPLHAYLLRRRLTEAARLLVKSNLPLPEIALLAGYDSQQAFTAAFRAMYKLPPAAYRERREFYHTLGAPGGYGGLVAAGAPIHCRLSPLARSRILPAFARQHCPAAGVVNPRRQQSGRGYGLFGGQRQH